VLLGWFVKDVESAAEMLLNAIIDFNSCEKLLRL
jgi:hypothetical protein